MYKCILFKCTNLQMYKVKEQQMYKCIKDKGKIHTDMEKGMTCATQGRGNISGLLKKFSKASLFNKFWSEIGQWFIQ